MTSIPCSRNLLGNLSDKHENGWNRICTRTSRPLTFQILTQTSQLVARLCSVMFRQYQKAAGVARPSVFALPWRQTVPSLPNRGLARSPADTELLVKPGLVGVSPPRIAPLASGSGNHLATRRSDYSTPWPLLPVVGNQGRTEFLGSHFALGKLAN
jgi:hypothetical protein